MSKTIAVIGGTGLCDWPGAEVLDETAVETEYGAPSALLQRIRYEGAEFCFWLATARATKFHRTRLIIVQI